MRIVTWNINGLGSLKFPFHIHAHHTHVYPTLDASKSIAPLNAPADDYEYDETALTDTPASTSALASSPARHVSDSGTDSVDIAVSPQEPSFPAFPTRRLTLSDVLVASYDELISYFQADG